ncbi:hypothetical protein FRC17_000277 [Serendipita sp. 399]|nr:hypothetical protein FRC17_000277 [Serendipita sp. 399]
MLWTTLIAATCIFPLVSLAAPLVRREVEDTQLLQFLNVMEQVESDFYKQTLAKFKEEDYVNAGFANASVPKKLLQEILNDENLHTTFLADGLRGEALRGCSFSFDHLMVDVKTALEAARVLEQVSVAGYIGAGLLVDDRNFLLAISSMLTNEARHESAMNVLGGGTSVPQAFDFALRPEQVMSVISPYISGCSLDMTPNKPLKLYSGLESGKIIKFDQADLPTDRPLFCQMLVGGEPAGLSQPLETCSLPVDKISGPIYMYITDDATPLAANILNQNTGSIVAGPAVAFVDDGEAILSKVLAPHMKHESYAAPESMDHDIKVVGVSQAQRYSPSLSMSMPGTPTTTARRRLSSSSRRGSTSAPDPWALATFDAPASSTSRLHIVRLPPPTKEEIEKYEKEHGASSRRGSWGSAMGLSKSLSMTSVTAGVTGGGGVADRSERLSFVGASSGHMARANSIDATNRPKIHPASQTGPLAPQQLYDLAMNSINPRISSESNTGGPITEPTPAVFTPLPAHHYLPFIVRSSEVQQLLSQGPPRRLWALIKQIYPTNLKEETDDPTKWPFWQLERWMFKVDRHEASDRVWVQKARACISRRSETLWEKLKNALGVPYELEMNDEDSDDENAVTFDEIVGGVSNMDIGAPAKPSASPQRPDPTRNEGEQSEDITAGDDIVDEFIDMGPTGLVMEAIYPSAAPQSPVTSHGSPSKHEEALGGMEIIGEEEEEEEDKATPGAASKEAEAKQPQEPDEEKGQTEMDTSRMVGITFISHSKYVPLQQYIERGEASDGEAIVDSPLFPTSFASLTEPGAIHRRGSRGAFVLEQGSMSVRGPFFKGMPRREYAVSTGSESDYDG